MNADFEFIATHPANFEIDITGAFHQIQSYWEYEGLDGKHYFWQAYSSSSKFKLPDLPDAVKAKYPDIDNNLFTLINVSVSIHGGVQTYDELLDKMFHQGIFYFNFVDASMQRSKDPEGLR